MSLRVNELNNGTVFAALAARRDMSVAMRVAAVVFITALTAAAAQISVPLPFTPVPFTLTPMIVLLGGAALGSRLGMTSQLLYLASGIVGLPVFAASPILPQGFARLLGPTGGYLMSYPIAAFVTGWLAERRFDRRYITSVIAMAAGLAIIFAGGVSWLAFFAQPDRSLATALALGFYQFLPADILKVLIAAAILPAVWKFIPGGLSRKARSPSEQPWMGS
jgi:biotin transport system substrate-specific component